MTNKESHQPGINTDEGQRRETPRFLDKSWMTQFAKRVYKETERQFPKRTNVGPASRLCFEVNQVAAELLREEGIKVDYLDYDRYETQGHTVIRVPGTPMYAIDFQYQQFIPEEEREGLPDFIVFPYRTEEDVEHELTKRGVTQKHGYWLERLFWDENGYPRR